MGSLPEPAPDDAGIEEIRAAAAAANRQVVVLDDDPTGCQTVHGVPLLARWRAEELAALISAGTPMVFLLTNSRSLPAEQAAELGGAVASTLAAVVRTTGRDITVISRSDSTLRGHYPAETEPIKLRLTAELGWQWGPDVLAPAFFEGGRVTVGDVHYVRSGDQFTPAAATEFARDQAFGFAHSNLRDWVAEKTRGAVPAAAVGSVDLELLRRGSTEQALSCLTAGHRAVIANCAAYADLATFVLAALQAEAAGYRFLYRTAASFVRVRGGIGIRPLLGGTDLAGPPTSGGGLVVVGSHVSRTTAQLQHLLNLPGLAALELDVSAVLTGAGEARRVAERANRRLSAGQDVVVFTSRTLHRGTDARSSLEVHGAVSRALVQVVRELQVRPRFLVAKGGITAHDLATEGLGVRQAVVLGQLQPGVPVWQIGPASSFPGLRYVVFPGNVGGPESLRSAVEVLQESCRHSP